MKRGPLYAPESPTAEALKSVGVFCTLPFLVCYSAKHPLPNHTYANTERRKQSSCGLAALRITVPDSRPGGDEPCHGSQQHDSLYAVERSSANQKQELWQDKYHQ